MIKHRYESCYPMESLLYIGSRFNNESFKPKKIKTWNHTKNEQLVYTTKEWLKIIDKEHLTSEIITLYDFKITTENLLIERLYLGDFNFQIYTQLNDDKIEEFFSYIFSLQGVLLFGDFNTTEDFFTRDDVCCKFAHELYPKHTEYAASWWSDNLYINHFFVYPKEQEVMKQCLTIGGKPLDITIDDKGNNTMANFYLMKHIPRSGKEAYIKKTDDLTVVNEFEKNIILSTIKALKKENIDFRVHHLAIKE